LTLIPALFLLIIGRNLVFGMHSAVIIAASDGSKVQVPGGSDELLEAVYQRIKQAIGAGGEPFHVSVDLVSEKIVPRTGSTAIARSSEITVDHDTASAKGSVGTASTTADASFDFEPAGAATDTSLGEAGYVNGSAQAGELNGGGFGTFGSATTTPVAATGYGEGAIASSQAGDFGYVPPSQDIPTTQDVRGAVGATAAVATAPAATATLGSPLAVEPGPIDRIDDLLAHLRDAKVPYVDDLSRMLIVVRDHLAGQNVTREEALGNWEAFRQYALEYLSGVEGLVPLIDQFHETSFVQG